MTKVDQKVKPEQTEAVGKTKVKAVEKKKRPGSRYGKAKITHQPPSVEDIASKITTVPSYQLKEVVIAGTTLKWLHEILKNFEVELEEVLSTSQASLYRQFKKEDIDLPLKDHLVSVLRIMQKGVQAFEDEGDFKQWLVSKIENLGNRRPLDLLSLETGRREVEQALDRIEYGVYG